MGWDYFSGLGDARVKSRARLVLECLEVLGRLEVEFVNAHHCVSLSFAIRIAHQY